MHSKYSLADLRIDLGRRQVDHSGKALDISGLTFDVLACLLVKGSAVVTFDELMAEVWAPAVVSEETVTQRIKLLRQALGDNGRHPRYIRSVRGVGYQLIVRPESLADEVDSHAKPPSIVGTRAPLWKRLSIPAATTLLLLVTTFAIWSTTRSTPPPGSAFLDRARYYASIGQKDDNERAIGLYRQALRESPNLTAATLGLSAAYSARVCHYNFPRHWLDRAESMARAVIRAEPRNALAYTALAYSEDCRGHIDKAIAHYEQAVRLDPDGRRDALSSVAYLYEVKGRLADALRTNLDLNREGAKLRFLDIQIAHSLELLGLVHAAEPRYAGSFALYPDNIFSNISWPRFLMTRGRLAEASVALDEALSRGTDRNDLQVLAGELALLRGDRAGAVECFERAAAMRPHASLAATFALLYAAKPPAPELLRERIDSSERAIDAGDHWPENWLEIALMHDALGDHAAAITALNRAVEAGFLDKAYLQISPLFRPLSTQPGFAHVIDTISQRVDEQRRIVLAAGWAPHEMMMATAAP